MSLSSFSATEGPRAWIWLAIALGVAVAGAVGFLLADRLFAIDREAEAEQLLGPQTITSAALISSSFERFSDPLLLISRTPDLAALARAEDAGGTDLITEETSEELSHHIGQIFKAAMGNGRFEKLRFINADGQELVKVILNGETTISAAPEELKDESHEDYFQIPRDRLQAGDIYSSRPRLESSDFPAGAAANASLRISTGVFDSLGRFHGIVVANVQVSSAFIGLHGFSDVPGETPRDATLLTETYVIDTNGQYLFGPPGTRLFGLDTGRGTTFQSDWGTEATADLAAGDVTTARGHIILASPISFGPTNDWTIVAIVNESDLASANHSPVLGAALMSALVLVLAIAVLLRRQFVATRREHAIAEELRGLDIAKSEFVALASHELRTPLTGVYGFACLLADTDDLSDEHRGWAEHIKNESSRLTEIVNDLLSISAIESGEVEFADELVDLNAVINAVVTQFASVSDRHEIVVTASDRPDTIEVPGDHNRLIEVVSNLVDNAIKYSPDGGAVRIACWSDETDAHVSVTDEGVGIAAEDLKRLFGKFQRISRPETETIRSTGLGLYMVKQLLTRLGGDITVTSIDGVGTTFTVTIPLPLATPLAA